MAVTIMTKAPSLEATPHQGEDIRIVVMGGVASGKTTIACMIANLLDNESISNDVKVEMEERGGEIMASLEKRKASVRARKPRIFITQKQVKNTAKES